MKITTSVVLFLLLSLSVLNAQNPAEASQIRCAFHEANPNLSLSSPSFENWMNSKNNETILSIAEKNEDGFVIKIPVIFHVLHYGELEGISTNLGTEYILAQLEQVNNDFRKREETSGYNNYEVGADIGLELELALYDNDGYALLTPGINRINTIEEGYGSNGTSGYSESFINSVIKPATQWDPTQYLNIWITDISSGALGFAQFPEASGLEGSQIDGLPETDGIVLNYKTVGSTNMLNSNAEDLYENYNKGRTLSHELGHWLGLRHIWGEGGCTTDDFCEDTPPSEGAHYGCPDNAYSCGTSDMVENYMDYTNDACMNVFTEDQKTRIHTVLNNSPRRVELQQSEKSIPHDNLRLFTFDVHLENWSAIINWSTNMENNNAHFIVYKSIDGENYYKLGQVAAAGFSDEEKAYQFIDEDPKEGTNYYKLAQIDFLDNENELGIRSFEYYLGFEMLITPNPTKGDLDISIWSESEGESIIHVYNLQGQRLILEEIGLHIGENKIDMDIDHLETGIYLVQIIKGPWQRCLKIQKI